MRVVVHRALHRIGLNDLRLAAVADESHQAAAILAAQLCIRDSPHQ
jgi:hypothetical protein